MKVLVYSFIFLAMLAIISSCATAPGKSSSNNNSSRSSSSSGGHGSLGMSHVTGDVAQGIPTTSDLKLKLKSFMKAYPADTVDSNGGSGNCGGSIYKLFIETNQPGAIINETRSFDFWMDNLNANIDESNQSLNPSYVVTTVPGGTITLPFFQTAVPADFIVLTGWDKYAYKKTADMQALTIFHTDGDATTTNYNINFAMKSNNIITFKMTAQRTINGVYSGCWAHQIFISNLTFEVISSGCSIGSGGGSNCIRLIGDSTGYFFVRYRSDDSDLFYKDMTQGWYCDGTNYALDSTMKFFTNSDYGTPLATNDLTQPLTWDASRYQEIIDFLNSTGNPFNPASFPSSNDVQDPTFITNP
jgi:hypothetical protein